MGLNKRLIDQAGGGDTGIKSFTATTTTRFNTYGSEMYGIDYTEADTTYFYTIERENNQYDNVSLFRYLRNFTGSGLLRLSWTYALNLNNTTPRGYAFLYNSISGAVVRREATSKVGFYATNGSYSYTPPITISGYARDVACDQNNVVYVIKDNDANVYKFDTSGNSLGSFQFGNSNDNFIFEADGVLFRGGGSSTVSRYLINTQTVASETWTFSNPYYSGGMAYAGWDSTNGILTMLEDAGNGYYQRMRQWTPNY